MVPRSHRPENFIITLSSRDLLTYGNDAATTNLTNAMWILDDGNMAACDPPAADSTNKGLMTRWRLTKRSQEIELYG